jgi:hypothetical protein
MHRSEELKDVIAILFEKLVDLNVLLGDCRYSII